MENNNVLPTDFNEYRITAERLRAIDTGVVSRGWITGKLIEIKHLFKWQYPDIDYANFDSLLTVPEIAFLLSAEALMIEQLLKKRRRETE